MTNKNENRATRLRHIVFAALLLGSHATDGQTKNHRMELVTRP